MKKNIAFAVSAFVLATTVFAGSINLGDFPIGNWKDANYDAIWEFSSGNIRITSPDGKVYCDFSQKTVNDFQVGASTEGPTISFSSPDTGRSYKFIKSLTGMDMTLEIERSGKPKYSVVMNKQ